MEVARSEEEIHEALFLSGLFFFFFFREESSTKGFSIVSKGGRIGRLSTRPSTTPLLAGTPNTVCVYISTHETLLNTARERERECGLLSLFFF